MPIVRSAWCIAEAKQTASAVHTGPASAGLPWRAEASRGGRPSRRRADTALLLRPACLRLRYEVLVPTCRLRPLRKRQNGAPHPASLAEPRDAKPRCFATRHTCEQPRRSRQGPAGRWQMADGTRNRPLSLEFAAVPTLPFVSVPPRSIRVLSLSPREAIPPRFVRAPRLVVPFLPPEPRQRG